MVKKLKQSIGAKMFLNKSNVVVKKFYVYKNPKKGNVIKLNLVLTGGGGKLAVKLKDPKARKSPC